jgi:halocyanin-like protein
MTRRTLDRRTFVRTTAALGAATALAGCSGGGESGGGNDGSDGGSDGGGSGDSGDSDGSDGGQQFLSQEPDYGGFLEEANNYEQTADMTGSDSVTVEVGAGEGLAFGPSAVAVSTGTTVTWEWTGEGGDHNVVATDGPAPLESELIGEAGATYEFEFTEDHAGITNYQCEPHASLGMLGAVAVGEDVPTVEVGGSSGGWPEDLAHDAGVPIQKHYVGIASFLGIAVSLVFAFYVLKYGESPNTGQGGA